MTRLLILLLCIMTLVPSTQLGYAATPTCPELLKKCALVAKSQQEAILSLEEAAKAREAVVEEQRVQLKDAKDKLAEERKSSIWKILGTALLVVLL